jgi:hypothetical protein
MASVQSVSSFSRACASCPLLLKPVVSTLGIFLAILTLPLVLPCFLFLPFVLLLNRQNGLRRGVVAIVTFAPTRSFLCALWSKKSAASPGTSPLTSPGQTPSEPTSSEQASSEPISPEQISSEPISPGQTSPEGTTLELSSSEQATLAFVSSAQAVNVPIASTPTASPPVQVSATQQNLIREMVDAVNAIEEKLKKVSSNGESTFSPFVGQWSCDGARPSVQKIRELLQKLRIQIANLNNQTDEQVQQLLDHLLGIQQDPNCFGRLIAADPNVIENNGIRFTFRMPVADFIDAIRHESNWAETWEWLQLEEAGRASPQTVTAMQKLFSDHPKIFPSPSDPSAMWFIHCNLPLREKLCEALESISTEWNNCMQIELSYRPELEKFIASTIPKVFVGLVTNIQECHERRRCSQWHDKDILGESFTFLEKYIRKIDDQLMPYSYFYMNSHFRIGKILSFPDSDEDTDSKFTQDWYIEAIARIKKMAEIIDKIVEGVNNLPIDNESGKQLVPGSWLCEGARPSIEIVRELLRECRWKVLFGDMGVLTILDFLKLLESVEEDITCTLSGFIFAYLELEKGNGACFTFRIPELNIIGSGRHGKEEKRAYACLMEEWRKMATRESVKDMRELLTKYLSPSIKDDLTDKYVSYFIYCSLPQREIMYAALSCVLKRYDEILQIESLYQNELREILNSILLQTFTVVARERLCSGSGTQCCNDFFADFIAEINRHLRQSGICGETIEYDKVREILGHLDLKDICPSKCSPMDVPREPADEMRMMVDKIAGKLKIMEGDEKNADQLIMNQWACADVRLPFAKARELLLYMRKKLFSLRRHEAGRQKQVLEYLQKIESDPNCFGRLIVADPELEEEGSIHFIFRAPIINFLDYVCDSGGRENWSKAWAWLLREDEGRANLETVRAMQELLKPLGEDCLKDKSIIRFIHCNLPLREKLCAALASIIARYEEKLQAESSRFPQQGENMAPAVLQAFKDLVDKIQKSFAEFRSDRIFEISLVISTYRDLLLDCVRVINSQQLFCERSKFLRWDDIEKNLCGEGN